MVLPGERQRVRSWHGCVVGLVLRGGNTALSCKEHAGVSAEYRGRRAAAVRSSEALEMERCVEMSQERITLLESLSEYFCCCCILALLLFHPGCRAVKIRRLGAAWWNDSHPWQVWAPESVWSHCAHCLCFPCFFLFTSKTGWAALKTEVPYDFYNHILIFNQIFLQNQSFWLHVADVTKQQLK